MEKDETKIRLITKGEIKQIVGKIAKAINEDRVGNEDYVLLCVQKGAAPFCADLQRELEGDMIVKNIKVTSYEGFESNEHPTVTEYEDMHDIKGKTVIITEDIIDRGITLQYLKHYLEQYEPKEIKIAVLLDKRERRDKDVTVKPDYTGLVIPDYFVIGYGLDYEERYRNLKDIRLITKNLSLLERFVIRRKIKKQMKAPVRTNTDPKKDEIRKACRSEMTDSIGKRLHEIDISKRKPEGTDSTLLAIAKDINSTNNRYFITSGLTITNLALTFFFVPKLNHTYGISPLRTMVGVTAIGLSFVLISGNKMQTDEKKHRLSYAVSSLGKKCGIHSTIYDEEKDAYLNHITRQRRKAIKILEKSRYSSIKK